MDKIKHEFDRCFIPWGIELPENKLKSKDNGVIEKSGWLIQFCFGEKDNLTYMDIYASNVMTNDRHFRIYEDGTGENLPAFPGTFSYNPDDKKKKEENFNKTNMEVAKLLHEKGFTAFTDGMKLGAQMRKDSKFNVSGYRENQRKKIIKIRDKLFSDPGGGIIGGVAAEFGLQDPWLNLWPGIVDDAIVYFLANKIPWWKAKGETSPDDEPSCHLLSSQVACVNHLYFLRQRQDLATSVLRNIDKRIISAEKIEDPDVSSGYVAFEIVGAKNYLNEYSHTRGTLSTSIDAVMVGKKENGKNVLFSIEWKYTEFYEGKNVHKDNHDKMYKLLLDEENCPIKSKIVADNNYDALYYDPFFQLMRQTLLSWKMVEAEEYNCDEYIHVHVIPEENKVLRLVVTSPKLPLNVVADGMCETWCNLLKEPNRYIVIDPKYLLQPLVNEEDTNSLLRYLGERYWDISLASLIKNASRSLDVQSQVSEKQLNYREFERKKAVSLLKTTNLFNGAKSGRVITYKGKTYPKEEVLLDGISNIYEPIQEDSLDYFLKNDIDFWHVPKAKEPSHRPTGHLLSSQVCCINHLFPIRNDKKNVLNLAQTICADFIGVLPINTDRHSPGYIQFESVSDTDHLNEGTPTRGSKCTSVDALIYAMHKNGKKYLLPIEWKYTENYDDEDKSEGSSGDTRQERYGKLIKKSKYLKTPEKLNGYLYFYEPFYQLMRQTLWSEQMIQHNNEERIKAEDYIHVHIIPNENDELLYKKYKITNKTLRESWLENLIEKDKYVIISPMDFLRNIDNNKYSDLLKYLQDRYWSGKVEYIGNRYWANRGIDRSEYIDSEFKKFDSFSGIGMDGQKLWDKASEGYTSHGGSMGLFAPKILESENEVVFIIDYASLRNATAYAVFFDKKTNRITRKMPYEIFLRIYDSLLESGFLESGLFSHWKDIFGGDNK